MKIITIDCAQISDKETFHTVMEEKLEFPSWYGRNLDALHDCLTEVFVNTQLRFVYKPSGRDPWLVYSSHPPGGDPCRAGESLY